MTELKRILIVDDEPLARQRLVRYVRQHDPSLLIEIAEDGLTAVEKLAAFQPHLVLLDIEMPGLNGFEVLRQFAARPFSVIFQTAYDQFAIRAFEENACDYLLKPFTAERLSQALARALTRQADEVRLQALEAQLAEREGYLRKFTVRQGTRWRLIEEQSVFCFISQDHYTCVYFSVVFGAESQLCEGIIDLSLKRLRERIDPAVFQQLHRNNIVRAAAVTALIRRRDGDWQVELMAGLKLPIARRHQAAARALARPVA